MSIIEDIDNICNKKFRILKYKASKIKNVKCILSLFDKIQYDTNISITTILREEYDINYSNYINCNIGHSRDDENFILCTNCKSGILHNDEEPNIITIIFKLNELKPQNFMDIFKLYNIDLYEYYNINPTYLDIDIFKLENLTNYIPFNIYIRKKDIINYNNNIDVDLICYNTDNEETFIINSSKIHKYKHILKFHKFIIDNIEFINDKYNIHVSYYDRHAYILENIIPILTNKYIKITELLEFEKHELERYEHRIGYKLLDEMLEIIQDKNIKDIKNNKIYLLSCVYNKTRDWRKCIEGFIFDQYFVDNEITTIESLLYNCEELKYDNICKYIKDNIIIDITGQSRTINIDNIKSKLIKIKLTTNKESLYGDIMKELICECEMDSETFETYYNSLDIIRKIELLKYKYYTNNTFEIMHELGSCVINDLLTNKELFNEIIKELYKHEDFLHINFLFENKKININIDDYNYITDLELYGTIYCLYINDKYTKNEKNGLMN